MNEMSHQAQALTPPQREALETSKSLKWSAYPDTLGLWVAESDFGLAPVVRESLQRAVDSDLTGYLPPWATRELAASAAGFMERHYGWEISASQVRPVADVLAALQYTITEFTRPGSAIVVPTPAYMPFLTLPPALGREVIQVPLVRDAEGAWVHDLDGIEAALQVGAGLVLLCNPHNPLGRVFEREELVGLAELVGRFDARIFADEIHAPIRYGSKPHIPFASISEQAAEISVTATSTSKAFNAPGLKCGQIILTSAGDRTRWREIGWLGEHGAGTLGAIAGAAAYRDGDEWLARFIAALAHNRTLLTGLVAEYLPEAHFAAPEGTYLGWLDLRPYRSENKWDELLRRELKISIVDGGDCGSVGTGHVRINFATAPQVLEEGLGRLGSFLRA